MPLNLSPSLLPPTFPTMTACSFYSFCSKLRTSSPMQLCLWQQLLEYNIISGYIQNFQSGGFSDSPTDHNYCVITTAFWTCCLLELT